MNQRPNFEPLPSARFSVEMAQGVEQIVVKASRNWLVIPFLSIWLFLWTLGGVTAISALFTDKEATLFLSIWLIGWAFGWAFAANWLGWQLAGKIILSVDQGALVYRWQMPLLSRTKLYDATQIRNLAGAEIGGMFAMFAMWQPAYPPFYPMQSGSVKFDYGGRTMRIVPGLDESEGRLIVERLAPKLPAGAVKA
jgi:hypothetical protein